MSESKDRAGRIRDRIVEFKRIKGSEILKNPDNWQFHPNSQREGFRGVAREIGIAGALVAYLSERHDGLTLINGEMRITEFPDQEWPVLITDLDDDEADLLLSQYDQIGKMAVTKPKEQYDLLDRVRADDGRVKALLDRQREDLSKIVAAHDKLEKAGDDSTHNRYKTSINEMDITIKAVLPVDDLQIVEEAIKATGERHRGRALIQICQAFINDQ